jgi:hypothetical protein
LAELGMDAKIDTPQNFAAALDQQAHAWKTVIEATEIKAD